MATVDHYTRRTEFIAVRDRELRQEFERNLAGYRARQYVLARRFRVADVDPKPYSEVTRAAIVARAERCGEPWRFAWTSGTTNEPKQIFYPSRRLRELADHCVDQVLLAAVAYGVTTPRFCFLSSFADDCSLSSLLARELSSSSLATEILDDYLALRSAAVKLLPRYSPLSIWWALLWSLQPTVVATVNPSSLCALLRNGRGAWPLLRDQVPQILEDTDWLTALDAVGLAGTRFEVLDWLTATTAPPTSRELLPHVELIYCWQGGYVRPFVDQLRDQLGSGPTSLAPMFSLSTEVVACSVFPHLTRTAGLPIYPECCYEFLPRDAEPAAENVLRPWDLVSGNEYRMIVSDDYGLVRYDTMDVFRCVGHTGDAPLIEFVRRHGLNYSFTGEKLNDVQLQDACKEVATANRLKGAAITCFPRRGFGPVPGYLFVLLEPDCPVDREQMARQLDDVLCRINCEYAAKRTTDRLAAPELITMPVEALVAMLTRALPRTAGANSAQFKLLPMYALLWEDVVAATGEEA